MEKTLVGPQLRQLRHKNKQTQAEMARVLGVSPAYINLLENNQRSLSVKMLVGLTETYGVDWRKLVNSNDTMLLADLRAAVRDPVFTGDAPDLQELRAALDHAPRLINQFIQLHQDHRKLLDNMVRLSSGGTLPDLFAASPETAIHDFFRDHSNHFAQLEDAADAARDAIGGRPDDLYFHLKAHLKKACGIEVTVMDALEMTDTLRFFDRDAGQILMSAGLDQVNRNFQLAHVLALATCSDMLDDLTEGAGISSEAGRGRCRIELANYFAAALLMPYDKILDLAETSHYDIDRIAASFGVSFEQACQRLTTLQRQGAQGVPFFFLRIDKAGNVTKRFNATPFTLAEQGGSCAAWNIHSAFGAPGTTISQFVELPDAGQFFTISRTTSRAVVSRQSQDRRLVVTLGCERAHVKRIGYAAPFNLDDPDNIAKIGINCHICPRHACGHRAHEPLHGTLPLNANRRGSTRYES